MPQPGQRVLVEMIVRDPEPGAADQDLAAVMAQGAAARGVRDVAGVDVPQAVGAGNVTGLKEDRGTGRRQIGHPVVRVKGAEMQGHIHAQMIGDPAGHGLDLLGRIVLARDQQGGDL